MKRKLSLIVLVAMLAVVCFGVLAACKDNGLSEYERTTFVSKVEEQIAKAQQKTSYTLSDIVVGQDVDGTEITCNVKWEATNGVTIVNGAVTVPDGVTLYILKGTLVDNKGNAYVFEGNPIEQAVSVISGTVNPDPNPNPNPDPDPNPNPDPDPTPNPNPTPDPNPNPTPSGDKGTQSNPYTVAEALAVINGLAQGGYSNAMVYTTGVVSDYKAGNSGQYRCSISDAGSSDKISVWYSNLGTGVTSFKNGDTIVVYGYLMRFYNSQTSVETPEITNKSDDASSTPTIVSVVEGSGTVTPTPTPSEGTATFDLTGKGASGSGVAFTTLTQGNITISASAGTNKVAPTYYAADLRLYGSNTLTIAATEGKTIKSITFTFNSKYDGTLTITVDAGTLSDGTWTGSASSVTFSIESGSGNRRLTAITVMYE